MGQALDTDTRTTILRLRREGHGSRVIARLVGHSRKAVSKVIREGAVDPPEPARSSQLDPYRERIEDLFRRCQGNLVLVQKYLHEEEDIEVPYTTLTAFARKHRIGVPPARRVGEYDFAAGEEMQHDTSPHDVVVGGKLRRLQCASLVLCFSRRVFARVYPTWNRFDARLFLDEALRDFGAVASRCMLDNSTVIIVSGTGRNAVPAPEMVAFGKRYGFEFVAHEKGDANRSARVERPFDFIETNFYPNRTFSSEDDVNQQLLAWCREQNGVYRRGLGFCPMERFEEERPFLSRLPEFLPEIYQVHPRLVDVEGWVNLDLNRYSVPEVHIGQRVEARESRDRVKVYLGRRLLADHSRIHPRAGRRSRIPGHHTRRGWVWNRKNDPATFPSLPEEATLAAQGPEFLRMLAALRKAKGGRAVPAIRRLHRLFLDFPTDVVRRAITRALEHNLLEIGRVERIVLRGLGKEVLRWPEVEDTSPPLPEEGEHAQAQDTPPASDPADPRVPGTPGGDTGRRGGGDAERGDGRPAIALGPPGVERPGAPPRGPQAPQGGGGPAPGDLPGDGSQHQLPDLPGTTSEGGAPEPEGSDDPETDQGSQDP